jgi:hypothetical protein
MYSCGKRLVWSPNDTVLVDAKYRMKLCIPWKDSQCPLIGFPWEVPPEDMPFENHHPLFY